MRYTASMELVDTHCHLTFAPLADDPAGVLARASKRGITRIVVPAYDLASFDDVARAGDKEGVFPAFGLHPWVADEPLIQNELETRLKKSNAIAVGEIGLDFKIDSPDRARQVEILRCQLEIASKLDLPVLLHCRGAFEELITEIDTFKGNIRGVVHAFSRGPELARRFIDLNLHVAFGGAMTRPNAKRARRAVNAVPLNRLLLETDAPFIGLDGVNPLDVEPHHIRDIAEAVASILDEPLSHIARSTSSNAKKLFRFG